MSERWFLQMKGKDYGPYDLEALVDMRQQGMLNDDSALKAESGGEIITARQLFPPDKPEVSLSESSPVSPQSPPPAAAEADDDFQIYKAKSYDKESFFTTKQILGALGFLIFMLLSYWFSSTYMSSMYGDPADSKAQIDAIKQQYEQQERLQEAIERARGY